jgi:hypothetical protein
MDVVMARYNENIKWIIDDKSMGGNYKFIIYNKGDPIDYPCKDVPNVGRESETYFRHIVENYENLTPYTLFLQGNPFDHSTTMLQTILPTIVGFFRSFNGKLRQFESDIIYERFGPETVHMKHYKSLFGDPVPPHLNFSSGCQWAVSRDLIRKHPKEFYEKLRQMIIDSEGTDSNVFNENYISPWTIERLFPYIFANEIQSGFKKYHKI